MAIWPFRRRSGRKRSRSGANLSDVEAVAAAAPPPPRNLTPKDASHDTTDRAATPKKQRLEQRQQYQYQYQYQHPSKKLHRGPRTYSFSPGRHDSIRLAGQKSSGPPVPGRLTGPFPADRNDGEEKGDPAWQRAPTLHNARHGQKKASSRRKSSKRRRAETDREAEIKAMTNFAPVRPAAEDWTSGRPIRKQSKRIKTGLGFRRSFENPASDVSLPISIHSSMSSESEMHSFRVSALAALAPRPTLHYAVSPKWAPGQSSSGQPRPHHQKRKVSERVPESVVRAHKRVNSFADDLDAADLRELMERDNRRRERKRLRDQEKMEKRLTRRAEKQREMEAEARHSGSPPPMNLERGVLGREMVGLGIDDTTSAVVTYSKRRASSSSSSSHRPARISIEEPPAVVAPQAEPMEIDHHHHHHLDLHRTSSIQPDVPLSGPSPEPVMERKPSTKLTPKGSMRLRRSFLRYKKSRSRSPNAPDDEHTVSPLSSRQDDMNPKASESSSRARLSFSALFRWGNRKRRNSGPSSFSNTSREEMQAAAAHAQTLSRAPPAEEAQTVSQTVPPTTNYIPRKVSSGVPKRTRSRFREDLPELPVNAPELPLSPPDSRMGSPEAEEPLPAVSEARTVENALDDSPAVVRHDTPTSEIRRVDEKMERLEKMRQTPTSLRHSIQPSPEPVSLASIDSEASWLSGRMSNRRSSGMRARASMQRFQQRNRSNSVSGNDTEEELADDEYLSNLATPSREMLADERTPRKSTGDAFPSSDEEELMDDGDVKWGSVERQRTTPVVQRQRIMSHQGQLNVFVDDSQSSGDNSDGEAPKLQRATSVSLSKGPVRHVSSGSTKMLEVSPRTSVDQRRTSDAVY
ncbi:uncharacterized protein CTRU02_214721 [Colletotrichum truncatum]|uniref:Uncharacterized protein n=1 Tax=Colletotrichum truncatum TaxID=5467 RepID=A0ACC3YFM2_COLTU|nr:uncharacterized protein CTRU02_09666 [Colletotrichum truncatum]KAF6788348.1 hypothetical protein CTRU02_09666 [Colletotrichum truncatum]